MTLPIYTHIPNLKGLTKIFFKLSRPKGNLFGGGGVTVLNHKYPRLLSGDTIIKLLKIYHGRLMLHSVIYSGLVLTSSSPVKNAVKNAKNCFTGI